MLRPEESHSALSERLKAMRSATCSPSRSVMRRSWPARNSKAVPVCGSSFFVIVFLYLFRFLCLLNKREEKRKRKRERKISMGEGTFALHRLEGRLPILLHRASGILSGFRLHPEIAQHRIDRTLQFQVACANRLLHPLPFSVRAQTFELFVRVEDQRRPGKPARLARAIGVQADHIERLPAEAEREV